MEQNKKQENEIEIDVARYWFVLKNRIASIIIFAIITAIAAGCITEFFIKPTYTASVSMYVYSNTDRVTTDSSISQSEITASQDLVNTYLYILKSDTVLTKVIDELQLKNATPSRLRSMISASQVENTVAFQVAVSSTDPTTAANIANAIAEVAPEEIVRVIKAGGVEVIDEAVVPKQASSPNIKKNILIGFALGFILSFALFFLIEILDKTISVESDITKNFNYPVLGTVPRLISVDELETEKKNKKKEKKTK